MGDPQLAHANVLEGAVEVTGMFVDGWVTLDILPESVRSCYSEEARFADWAPMVIVHLVGRTHLSTFDANL